MHTRNALVAVLMTCAFIGCSKTETKTSPTTPVEDFTAYKPVIPDGPSESEKLIKERLELERQKAELERLKLEHQIEVERQKAQIELDRERRIEAERKADREQAEAERKEAKSRLEAQAQTFTSTEYANLRQSILDSGNTLGRALLRCTHPTGSYGSADLPLVTISPNQDTVTGTILVYWKGGLSDKNYQTSFVFSITKKGVEHFEIGRDTAIIPINEQNIPRAKAEVKKLFDPK